MIVEPVIRLSNEPLIKPFLAAARFVAAAQDDGLPLRVESESETPGAVLSGEAQLLHVGVTRSLQRIGMRAAQIRPGGFQSPHHSNQLVLNGVSQLIELRDEIVM